MQALASLQARIAAASRFAIPAVAHEECLTGFAAWTATIFPTPLAWGASFDPDLVHDMARSFGATMHAAGIHQGLAPVLDVTRDPRWGRTEETIGEDPYLVGTIGTAYVTGLQGSGVEATLKHFIGYSASRAARNHAPVSMGPRELTDVMLVPFEMAIRLGGARSVMPTYVEVDGVPASADEHLLTTLLRDELGFDGLVVSDYFAVSFLELQHAVAASPADAARLALAAGLDVELPNFRCFGAPLLAAGHWPAMSRVELIDRAAARVLRQKLELGLLDPGLAVPVRRRAATIPTSTRPPSGTSPGGWPRSPSCCWPTTASAPAAGRRGRAKVVVVGPLADDQLAFFGCYTHAQAPRSPGPGGHRRPWCRGRHLARGAARGAARRQPTAAAATSAATDRFQIAAAVAAAREADVVIAVVGRRGRPVRARYLAARAATSPT